MQDSSRLVSAFNLNFNRRTGFETDCLPLGVNVTQEIAQRVNQEMLVGGMDPEKFAPILSAFGPLGDEDQLELAQKLVGAVAIFRLEQIPMMSVPSVERNELFEGKGVAASAHRLCHPSDSLLT